MSIEESLTELTDAEMLKRATTFDVEVDVKTRKFVRIESRYYGDGGKSWVVVNSEKFVLNIHGAWEWESPVIAARSDNFIARTRWDHPREAMRAALAAIAAEKEWLNYQSRIAGDKAVSDVAEN